MAASACVARWRKGLVKDADRRPPRVRAQVGIARRHLDRGMAHQLLNDLQRYAAHGEMTSVAVAQVVPANLPHFAGDACRSKGMAQRCRHLAFGERLATLLAEHEAAPRVLVGLEGIHGCKQFDRPLVSVLWQSLHPAPDDSVMGLIRLRVPEDEQTGPSLSMKLWTDVRWRALVTAAVMTGGFAFSRRDQLIQRMMCVSRLPVLLTVTSWRRNPTLPEAGLNTSAVGRGVPKLSPPVTSTVPLGSSVAVWA